MRDDIYKKKSLISAIEFEVMFSKISYAEAYKKVTDPQYAGPKMTTTDNSNFETNFDDSEFFEGEEDGDDFDKFDEEEFIRSEQEQLLEQMFNSLYGSLGYSKADRKKMFEKFKKEAQMYGFFKGSSSGQIQENNNQTRHTFNLSYYYRLLARRLHPDVRSDLTDYECKLWNQTQVAYDNKDIAMLQRLWVLANISDRAKLNNLPVSDIVAAQSELKLTVKAAQKDLRKYRKLPSWKFSRKSTNEKEVLKKIALSEFNELKSNFKWEVKKLEFELDSFRADQNKHPLHSVEIFGFSEV